MLSRIVLLVDFKANSSPGVLQAWSLAKLSGAQLIALHVNHGHEHESELTEHVKQYVNSIIGEEVPMEVMFGKGDYLTRIPELLEGIKPDLVVICTHGIHGIAQHLFGANILKLIREIAFTSLVVHENSRIIGNGFQKMLMPASPYPEFTAKMVHTARIAELTGGDIVFYEIDKYLADSEELISENFQKAEQYYKKRDIPFARVVDEPKGFSMGFAQQTLQYARENGFDVICLSNEIHDESIAMGKVDKEKFLTNKDGIPVLCCAE
jgi:nucleotide-binding universal stress UspA family protein